MNRTKLKASMALVAAILASPAVKATGIDLHRLWDNRCAECHGHASDFSRKFLNGASGKLQGRHHVNDLRQFMHNHYLIDSEVDAVYDMLLAQANTQTRFREECSSCHELASMFVRNSMELRDGQLYSRKSGRPVRQFLHEHRELNPDDIEFYIKLLTRIAKEVYRP